MQKALVPEDLAAHPWSAGFRGLLSEHDYDVDEIEGAPPGWLRGTLFRNGSGRNELNGQLVSPLVRRRRNDLGDPLRSRRHPLSQPLRRDAELSRRDAAGRIVHRGFGKMRPGGVLANALRQPAQRLEHLGRHARATGSCRCGRAGRLTRSIRATLETLGVEDFGGKVERLLGPSQDRPDTGEMFNFGIDYGRRTTLTPYRIAKGALTRLPPVTLPYPVMNHDFVLTANYLVFCLGPILVRPLRMILGFSSFDGALAVGRRQADPDPARAARRPRRAALDRNRAVLPVPFRQRLRGGRRARPRPDALSRLRRHRRRPAQLLALRLAGQGHGVADSAAGRPRDRQGRDPALRGRQRPTSSRASIPQRVGRRISLRLHRLQPARR